jgi:hypothetical protein
VSRIDEADPLNRTLPVIDPALDGSDWARLPDLGDRQTVARVRRLEMATQALRTLYNGLPAPRRQDASLLGDATRFLNRLLEVEYPNTNLPMLLRSEGASDTWRDYSVLGTVHRAYDREHGPRLYVNRVSQQSDAVTFAQAEFFLPRPRYRCCPWAEETPTGVVNHTDPWPRDWNSFSQTWTVRLVPADETAALTILQTPPPSPATGMRPPTLNGVMPLDIERVNTH